MSTNNIYTVSDGFGEFTVEAGSLDDAVEKAKQETLNAFDTQKSTYWVSLTVWEDDAPDECQDAKITIDPDEPECKEDEHDYQSPHELVGGLESNPGVFGAGGGVVVKEVCMHCGTLQTTNTWAQDPHDGEQGLRSLRYDGGLYADEIVSDIVVELESAVGPYVEYGVMHGIELVEDEVPEGLEADFSSQTRITPDGCTPVRYRAPLVESA